MFLANYHSHSMYSDGKLHPQAYIEAAIDQNLLAYGFSDHAPFPFPNFEWCMLRDKWKDYLTVVDQLQLQFGEHLNIYKSLEVDYIPGFISVAEPWIEEAALDYTIGSIHFVDFFADGTPWSIDGTKETFEMGLRQIFDNSIEAVIRRYYELTRKMIAEAPPTIVAHLDRIRKNNLMHQYFTEKESWYKEEIILTLEAIAQAEIILEVNTKTCYRHQQRDPNPSLWILKIASELNIPVHLASDAHHPKDITGGFDTGRQVLKKAGFKEQMLLLEGDWQPVPLKSKSIFSG